MSKALFEVNAPIVLNGIEDIKNELEDKAMICILPFNKGNFNVRTISKKEEFGIIEWISSSEITELDINPSKLHFFPLSDGID